MGIYFVQKANPQALVEVLCELKKHPAHRVHWLHKVETFYERIFYLALEYSELGLVFSSSKRY